MYTIGSHFIFGRERSTHRANTVRHHTHAHYEESPSLLFSSALNDPVREALPRARLRVFVSSSDRIECVRNQSIKRCFLLCVCVGVSVCVCVLYCLLLDMNEIRSLTVYKDLFVFFYVLNIYAYTYTHLAWFFFVRF